VGGGGGGGAAGDASPLPNAFRAACMARAEEDVSFANECMLEGGPGGEGGGCVDRSGGGRGAELGGSGGRAGGMETADDKGGRREFASGSGGPEGGAGAGECGGGGAAAEVFLNDIGGGGGFDVPGGGGGALGGRSDEDCGLRTGFGGTLRRFATSGFEGCDGDDSVVCGEGLDGAGFNAFSRGAVGGFGADEMGGFAAELLELSGSERYDESRPVSMPPPVFLSFGIPAPANIPPSWGPDGNPPESPPPPLPLPPVSLLLLARFDIPPFEAGGASSLGGFRKPDIGTGGAPSTGGPTDVPLPLSTRGADRSLVTAFLSLAPLVISVSKAP